MFTLQVLEAPSAAAAGRFWHKVHCWFVMVPTHSPPAGCCAPLKSSCPRNGVSRSAVPYQSSPLHSTSSVWAAQSQMKAQREWEERRMIEDSKVLCTPTPLTISTVALLLLMVAHFTVDRPAGVPLLLPQACIPLVVGCHSERSVCHVRR